MKVSVVAMTISGLSGCPILCRDGLEVGVVTMVIPGLSGVQWYAEVG